MEHAWQTGRYYTEQGQRIGAVVDGDSWETPRCIWFYDIDRSIRSVIEWRGPINNRFELEDIVLFCYDRGHFGNEFRFDFELREEMFARCRKLAEAL